MKQHPPDEQLSAHLDGEAPELAAHVDGCAPCRARLAELGRVAKAVGLPVPPPDPATRDAAVAAALEAFGVRADITPADASVRSWRRLAVVGTAAAVLAVAVAVPLLARHGKRTHTLATAAPSKAVAGNGFSAVVEGGDLGDQSDAATLAALVDRSLPRSAETAADSAAGAGTSAGAAGSAAPATPTAGSLASCPAPADGGGARVVYQATLRWKGAPASAAVLVGPAGRRLVVMDQATCRVLVDRTF